MSVTSLPVGIEKKSEVIVLFKYIYLLSLLYMFKNTIQTNFGKI